MRDLTTEEIDAIQKSVDLWESLKRLEVIHPDDIHEHRRDIHDIQNRIMARPYVELSNNEPT